MMKTRKLSAVLAILLFNISLCFSQEIGLVLSGGGGKGAYQVGVWKAMQEYGIAQKVTVISGSSVGGLNAALFAMKDISEIEQIWRYLVPSSLQVDEDGNDVLISQPGLKMIINTLPLDSITELTYPQVNVTAVRKRFSFLKSTLGLLKIVQPGDNATHFWVNAEDDIEEKKKLLLATSAFPFLTDPILLKDGYEYQDGGNEIAGGDNTPIGGIVNSGYKYISNVDTIYVVYLKQNPRRVKVTDYDTFNIIEIIPSVDLSGILDGTCNFTPERVNLLINIGYQDAVNLFKSQGLHPVSSFWFTVPEPISEPLSVFED